MTIARHTVKPDCWSTTAEPSLAGWAWDRGASCGNARSPSVASWLLESTPGCGGCARLERGRAIARGEVPVFEADRRGVHAKANAEVDGAFNPDMASRDVSGVSAHHGASVGDGGVS